MTTQNDWTDSLLPMRDRKEALAAECAQSRQMLRWSDGHSCAVEFPFAGGKQLAARMASALEIFRFESYARAELHVRVATGTVERWSDPVIVWGIDRELTAAI